MVDTDSPKMEQDGDTDYVVRLFLLEGNYLLVNLPVVTVSVAIEVGRGTHHKQEAGTNSPLMCSMGTPVEGRVDVLSTSSIVMMFHMVNKCMLDVTKTHQFSKMAARKQLSCRKEPEVNN